MNPESANYESETIKFMQKNIKINLLTLGCPKNRVDSENILGLLAEKGFSFTARPEEAEVIIVNTCSFIADAKEESIGEILKLAQYKKNASCQVLLVAGCLPARYKAELMAEIPEIDAIITPGNIKDVVSVVLQSLQGKKIICVKNNNSIFDNPLPRVITGSVHSVYIKIADGCNHNCTFCIIPQLRGRYKSRPLEEIIDEAQQLVLQGAREINLIAQDTSFYGMDLYGQKKLPLLLKKLCKIPDIKWLRILYAHPLHVDQELLKCLAEEEKVCSYLDIPLQHVAPEILKEMGRGGSRVEDFLDKCREIVPDIVLRSTFIVGFPGEKRRYFHQLMAFFEKYNLERVGVFTYSPEEGTKAAQKISQLPGRLKKYRYHQAMSFLKESSCTNNKKLLGKCFDVMVDKFCQKDYYSGRYFGQAPEVDGKVYFKSEQQLLPGEIIEVKITAVASYDLLGERT